MDALGPSPKLDYRQDTDERPTELPNMNDKAVSFGRQDPHRPEPATSIRDSEPVDDCPSILEINSDERVRAVVGEWDHFDLND